MTLLTLLLPHLICAEVVTLTRENWFHHIAGAQDWYIMFSQYGCPHCARLEPMWLALEQQLTADGAAVRVGKVNVSADNGIALTFGVRAAGVPPTAPFHPPASLPPRFLPASRFPWGACLCVSRLAASLRSPSDGVSACLPPRCGVRRCTSHKRSSLRSFSARLTAAAFRGPPASASHKCPNVRFVCLEPQLFVARLAYGAQVLVHSPLHTSHLPGRGCHVWLARCRAPRATRARLIAAVPV